MSITETTERQAHLDWCKQRALEYVDAGDLPGAFASFSSDVTKHPETQGISETIAMLGMPMLVSGLLDTAVKMRDHIEGYN
ncbi:MAG: hypothetical protein V3S15_07215 [Woeseiaceae bacterium]